MAEKLRDKARSALDMGMDTAKVVDEAIYGSLGQLSTGKVVAKPISIFEITHDPTQPRRAVPTSVRLRSGWNGGPETTKGLFDTWMEVFAEESGMDSRTARIIITRLVEGKPLDEDDVYQEGSEAERQFGTATAALLRIVDKASSLRRDGQINPITIYQIDPAAPPGRGGYRIETGEHRWLAMHLLYLFTGDAKWNRIKAEIVTAPSVWRQAVENNVRDDLTAIGKARQLAILIMDLYRQTGHQFQPYEAFDHDRHFYAQVADGNVAFRIPPGKGEEIMQAMGLKSPKTLAKFRALLRIPDELWAQADDEGWTEGFIREQASRLRNEFADTSPIGEVPPIQEAEDEPEESLRGFQVDDWISADLGDHVMTGQVTGIEDEKLVVMTEKGTARIDPVLTRGITLHAYPPEEASYIHSEPVSAPPTITEPQTGTESWVNSYKTNKKSTPNLVAVLLLDSNAILLREDAKEAAQLLNRPAFQRHYHFTNTEHGMALFLMGEWILNELNRLRTVVTYTEQFDQENLRAFWHRHVVINRQKAASAPPSSPKQHPNPNTHDPYMHRIYDGWRGQFPKETIVLVEYDGAYLAFSHDDSLIRSGEWRGLNPGSIGLSGSVDQMLVTKVDLPFVRHLQKRSVMIVRFDDLDEDMQFVAGKAGRARSVPLNRLADFQAPDEVAERAKAEREAREEASRALLLEWQETLKQWEAQAKDFKARAAALRLKEAGQAATETQRFSSFINGFKAWLERKQ